MKFMTIIAAFLISTLSAIAQTYPPNIAAINPSSLIHVNAPADVTAVRNSLIDQIFHTPSLDTTKLPVFDYNYTDSVWAAMQNMGPIQAMNVPLKFGANSKIWQFKPVVYRNINGGKCGFIVNAGHGQVAVWAPFQYLIERLIYSGCEVTAIDMPFSGQNQSTLINTGYGRVQVINHAQLHQVKTPSFSPLQWFMEAPLAIVNDYTNRGITNIGMTGLSGGGWTTDLYAAIDPRIKISYSIAGSMPLYMRNWVTPMSLGDWEQAEISSLGVDYQDLYILASNGAGRRHANLYIVNDDCCFGGYAANHFAPATQAAVTGLGAGSFSVAFDTTVSTHTVSPWTVSWITTDLASWF